MVSSEERCEVARRLREAWPEAGGIEEVWEVLDPILGTHDGPDVYKAWEQTFNRLADLIDPTCEMTDARWDNGECTWGCICSACDAHIEHEEGRFLDYCPRCGARVVSGDGE